MKKEILTGLIVIVAIAAIAIFVVNPSMSTSVEIDGKLTSNELELLFLGSGDDEYQEYKYVSYKIEKNRISASAGGAEVYEAGFGGDFLNWLKDLFSGWLNDAIVDVNEAFPIDDVNPEDTDPDVVIEDIGDLVEDEKTGEPGPSPVAGEATGKYAGPMELIIDGELSEEEKSMLDAMGVGEIVYNEAVRGDYNTGIQCLKSSHMAFLKKDGRYMLYLHEEADPRMMNENVLREIRIKPSYSQDGFPKIVANIGIGKCGFFKDKDALFNKGFSGIDQSLIYPIKSAYSADGCGMECIIKDVSPDIIKGCISTTDVREILVDTSGGIANLNPDEIPIIEIKDVLIN